MQMDLGPAGGSCSAGSGRKPGRAYRNLGEGGHDLHGVHRAGLRPMHRIGKISMTMDDLYSANA